MALHRYQVTGIEFPDLFSVEAEAATYSGTCGDTIKWSLDTETGVLNITGTGEMYNFDPTFLPPWLSYCSCITEINIADGITSIGGYAFCHCSSLTEIILPDSIKTIEEFAFAFCSVLIY